jgi:hypothetical protein
VAHCLGTIPYAIVRAVRWKLPVASGAANVEAAGTRRGSKRGVVRHHLRQWSQDSRRTMRKRTDVSTDAITGGGDRQAAAHAVGPFRELGWERQIARRPFRVAHFERRRSDWNDSGHGRIR